MNKNICIFKKYEIVNSVVKPSRTLWGLPGYKNPCVFPISCLFKKKKKKIPKGFLNSQGQTQAVHDWSCRTPSSS